MVEIKEQFKKDLFSFDIGKKVKKKKADKRIINNKGRLFIFGKYTLNFLNV